MVLDHERLDVYLVALDFLVFANEVIERLPRGFDTAYQVVAGQRRPLPTGATWDAAAGILSWQPAPGFLGRYRVVFTNGRERINVRVVVVPTAITRRR